MTGGRRLVKAQIFFFSACFSLPLPQITAIAATGCLLLFCPSLKSLFTASLNNLYLGSCGSLCLHGGIPFLFLCGSGSYLHPSCVHFGPSTSSAVACQNTSIFNGTEPDYTAPIAVEGDLKQAPSSCADRPRSVGRCGVSLAPA